MVIEEEEPNIEEMNRRIGGRLDNKTKRIKKTRGVHEERREMMKILT